MGWNTLDAILSTHLCQNFVIINSGCFILIRASLKSCRFSYHQRQNGTHCGAVCNLDKIWAQSVAYYFMEALLDWRVKFVIIIIVGNGEGGPPVDEEMVLFLKTVEVNQDTINKVDKIYSISILAATMLY